MRPPITMCGGLSWEVHVNGTPQRLTIVLHSALAFTSGSVYAARALRRLALHDDFPKGGTHTVRALRHLSARTSCCLNITIPYFEILVHVTRAATPFTKPPNQH
ncbi:unnamed protein product [Meganyctiphanes norvegica]|uniref:Uncharacterized protein n=1 Tax=Meganyctiphanes norvegica TaxID=48144 RepID=A0AAV2S2Y3_MEGNR